MDRGGASRAGACRRSTGEGAGVSHGVQEEEEESLQGPLQQQGLDWTAGLRGASSGAQGAHGRPAWTTDGFAASK